MQSEPQNASPPQAYQPERRSAPRHRTLKAGRISFNRSAGFDCRVRNMSVAGAMLDVASPLGIPDDFVLVIEGDHFKQQCHVVWRTQTRLGVAFSDAKALQDTRG